MASLPMTENIFQELLIFIECMHDHVLEWYAQYGKGC